VGPQAENLRLQSLLPGAHEAADRVLEGEMWRLEPARLCRGDGGNLYIDFETL